jgi:uncharacterized protein YeaO (DUF488 family)
MPPIVHTARLGYCTADGLDVTRNDPVGVVFAPSPGILRPALAAVHKRPKGTLEAEWAACHEAYVAEMRRSYRDARATWDEVLARPSLTLRCFCADAERCHRTVLAEILVRLGAVFVGERGRARLAPVVQAPAADGDEDDAPPWRGTWQERADAMGWDPRDVDELARRLGHDGDRSRVWRVRADAIDLHRIGGGCYEFRPLAWGPDRVEPPAARARVPVIERCVCPGSGDAHAPGCFMAPVVAASGAVRRDERAA